MLFRRGFLFTLLSLLFFFVPLAYSWYTGAYYAARHCVGVITCALVRTFVFVLVLVCVFLLVYRSRAFPLARARGRRAQFLSPL